MQRVPGVDERCYTVTCPVCQIAEDLVFRGMVPRSASQTTFRPHLPLFFRLVPMVSGSGEPVVKHFRPRRGLLGDQLPKTCPQCGGKLSIVPGILWH